MVFSVQSIPARYWGKNQPNNDGDVVTLHTIQCPNNPGYAVKMAKNWFQSRMIGKDGKPHPASANYAVDPTNTVLLVPANRISWHCGNGNGRGIGIEQAGYAQMTRAQWLGDNGVKTMLRAADVAANWMKPRGIPVRWLSTGQTRNGARGINDHRNMSEAYGGSDHWDVGEGYPRDVFLRMVGDFIRGSKPKEIDVPNTPQQLEDAAYNAMLRILRERHDTQTPGDPVNTFREMLDNFPEMNLRVSDLVEKTNAQGVVLEEIRAAVVQPESAPPS